jgi:hypothetical protein
MTPPRALEKLSGRNAAAPSSQAHHRHFFEFVAD